MMEGVKVYLDNEALEDAGQSLAAALEAGGAAARRRGRIVVEVYADGAAAPETHLSDPPTHEPYADELRLVTADPLLLVRSTMFDAADALESTNELHRHAATLLQTGSTVEAMQALGQTLHIWEIVRRGLTDSCSLLQLPVDQALATELDTAVAERLTDELAAKLSEIRDALASEDWAALADLLAYDMADQVETWRDALRRFAESIPSEGAPEEPRP